MRFVPEKSEEQQASTIVFRARDLLSVRQGVAPPCGGIRLDRLTLAARERQEIPSIGIETT